MANNTSDFDKDDRGDRDGTPDLNDGLRRRGTRKRVCKYCADKTAVIELTHNWGRKEAYPLGEGFGHLAIGVPDAYKACEDLSAAGVKITRRNFGRLRKFIDELNLSPTEA